MGQPQEMLKQLPSPKQGSFTPEAALTHKDHLNLNHSLEFVSANSFNEFDFDIDWPNASKSQEQESNSAHETIICGFNVPQFSSLEEEVNVKFPLSYSTDDDQHLPLMNVDSILNRPSQATLSFSLPQVASIADVSNRSNPIQLLLTPSNLDATPSISEVGRTILAHLKMRKHIDRIIFMVRVKRMGYDPCASIEVPQRYLVHEQLVRVRDVELSKVFQDSLVNHIHHLNILQSSSLEIKRELFAEARKEFNNLFPEIHLPSCSSHLEQQAMYLTLGLYHSSVVTNKVQVDQAILIANCQLEAMKWQLEILEDWIKQLNEYASQDDHNIVLSSLPSIASTAKSLCTAAVRRPGRPPGSRKKHSFAHLSAAKH